MNYSRLEADVMADEGFRSEAYQDVVGVWTIGYGTTRIFGVPVTEQTSDILQRIARDILRADLYQALIDAQAVVANFATHNPVRQEVLVNMAYNLGRSGLAGFRKMIVALADEYYETAADEMLDSKWAGQVKTRAIRLHNRMREGA